MTEIDQRAGRNGTVIQGGCRLTRDRSTSLSLLEQARNRDEDAWSRMVQLYSPLVVRWCAASGVRGSDLDDLVQDVFQAVFTGLDGFRRDRRGDTFRGWLRTITHFKVSDFYRRRVAHPAAQGGSDAYARLEQLEEPVLPEDTEDDLGDLYRRALELVRGEFEERTWSAFWRTAVEGQAPADIAAELGVTPAAIRKAKSRVLHRLRQEVGDLLD